MKPNTDCLWKVLTGVLGILLACVLFGTVSQARGDDTVPEASTGIGIYFYSTTTSTVFSTDTVTTAPFTSSSSASPSGMDGLNSYTASGTSIVNPDGTLGATSTISVSGPSPTFIWLSSLAYSTDELTVTAVGVPAGTVGTFYPTGTVTGTLISSNDTNLVNFVIVNASYGIAGTVGGAEADIGGSFADTVVASGSDCSPTSPSLGTVSCTLPFAPLPFQFGVPFEVVQLLDAFVLAEPGPGGMAEGGTSNFLDTAQITSIAVDANGNPVTDFSITSASGLDYTANGITPEPSSLSLFGVGLLFLAFMVKRRLPFNVF
jgi:hypothetical protein